MNKLLKISINDAFWICIFRMRVIYFSVNFRLRLVGGRAGCQCATGDHPEPAVQKKADRHIDSEHR